MLKYFSTMLLGLLLTVSVAAADSVMTWSAYDGSQQGMNVYVRKEAADDSAVERQITRGGTHLSPTLQMDGSIIWLAWIDRAEAKQYVLHYAVLLANSLTLIETGTVAAQDARIYSPSIAISPEGTPWLAWAGFDGQDEEIRISHYENGLWVSERSLTNNEIPDSKPRFEILSNGSLRLSWEQTTYAAVVQRQVNIAAIENYSLSLLSPSKAIIKYKKRMSQRRAFSNYTELPASLEKRRKDILMGNRVEFDR